jgi:hypothetical protein
MATYGGGITFSVNDSFTDCIVSTSQVVYTVPADTYVDFKFLSLNVIAGTGVSNFSDTVIVIENNNGTGGWITQDTFTYNTLYAATPPSSLFVLDQEIKLYSSQRIRISNTQTSGAGSQTVRFSWVANEYSAST